MFQAATASELDTILKEEIDERRRQGKWNPKSRAPSKNSHKWKRVDQSWAPTRHGRGRSRGRGRSSNRTPGRGSRGRANFHTRRNFKSHNGIPAELNIRTKKRKPPPVTSRHVKNRISVKWTCRVCSTANESHHKPCNGCGKKFDTLNDSHTGKIKQHSKPKRKHHHKLLRNSRGKGRSAIGKRKGGGRGRRMNKSKDCPW